MRTGTKIWRINTSSICQLDFSDRSMLTQMHPDRIAIASRRSYCQQRPKDTLQLLWIWNRSWRSVRTRLTATRVEVRFFCPVFYFSSSNAVYGVVGKMIDSMTKHRPIQLFPSRAIVVFWLSFVPFFFSSHSFVLAHLTPFDSLCFSFAAFS